MASASLVKQAEIPILAVLYGAQRLSAAASSAFKPANSINTRVGLIRHDITKLELPNGAIVNAANKSLLGGGGVDGAIHRAAGGDLLTECRTLSGADTGEAKITGAYKLPCKNVVHTVGPVYYSGEQAECKELLKSCYRESLKLAVGNGLSSIAFSAISTGVYGYPSQDAADTACETVREFMETEDGEKLELVVFCNFEMKDVDAYEAAIPKFFPPVEASRTAASSSAEKETQTEKDESHSAESAAADFVVIEKKDAEPEVETGAVEKEKAKED